MLRIDRTLPLPISRLDLPPDDLGFAGAGLGTEDNQTTGAFTDTTTRPKSAPCRPTVQRRRLTRCWPKASA